MAAAGRAVAPFRTLAHSHDGRRHARRVCSASLRMGGVLRRRGLALVVTAPPVADLGTGPPRAYAPAAYPTFVAARYSLRDRDAVRTAHRHLGRRGGAGHALWLTLSEGGARARRRRRLGAR